MVNLKTEYGPGYILIAYACVVNAIVAFIHALVPASRTSALLKSLI